MVHKNIDITLTLLPMNPSSGSPMTLLYSVTHRLNCAIFRSFYI